VETRERALGEEIGGKKRTKARLECDFMGKIPKKKLALPSPAPTPLKKKNLIYLEGFFNRGEVGSTFQAVH
jgi:hypothetical protein